MAFGSKNVATIAAGALFVAVVAFIVFSTLDEEPGPSEPERADPIPKVERTPLPDDVKTVPQVLTLAEKHAKRWRADAERTRLYATQVGADGSLGQGARVQVVFISDEATEQRTDANGWRLSVQDGAYGGTPIWQHPAPELDEGVARWCKLADVVGEGAPERFTLDLHYAKRAGQGPVMLLFTRQPRRWLVGVDPFTCQVHERSRDKTVEEQQNLANAGDASGVLFDARAVAHEVSKVIEVSKCRVDGAGRATVQVTFDKTGRALDVAYLAGDVGSTEAGRCLEQELLKLETEPWQRGDGRAAARFKW